MESQLGVSYTLTIRANDDIAKTNLLRRIKKSESALISVPELELDEPEGNEKDECTVLDILQGIQTNLDKIPINFVTPEEASDWLSFKSRLSKLISGNLSATFILTDPSSESWVEQINNDSDLLIDKYLPQVQDTMESGPPIAVTVGEMFDSLDVNSIYKNHETCSECSNRIRIGEKCKACWECMSYVSCMNCEYKHNHSFFVKTIQATEKPVIGDTVAESLKNAFEYWGEQPSICPRRNAEWMTYSQLYKESLRVGSGLRKYLNSRSMVGICAGNRIEWFLADYGCIFMNMVSFGVHLNFDDSALKAVVQNSKMNCFIGNNDAIQKILRILPECPSLVLLVAMDPIPPNTSCPIPLIPFSTLLQTQEILQPEFPDRSEIFTIKYTSGSTGVPKGAVMLNSAWNKHLTMLSSNLKPLVSVSFSPLAHSTHFTNMQQLYSGALIGICENVAELFEDFKYFRPTVIGGVPRIWNKMYADYQLALHLSSSKEDVLKQFRALLGDRVRLIVTGGALTSPNVVSFLRECFPELAVIDSYGITEVGGITTGFRANTDVKVKLVDVPELGFFTTDKPYPRGEVCVKSPYMSEGYYGDEALTKSSFVNGWFYTGDIAVMKPNGELEIFDRKKHIFKLSQGEFVSPENIENLFIGKCEFVEQMFVYGNSNRADLVAVIVPNERICLNFVEEKENWIQSKSFKNMLLNKVNEIGLKEQLKPWEIPKDIYIDNEVWTSQNGLLTESLKLPRLKLYQRYKTEIETMYAALEPNIESRLETLISKVLNKSSGDFFAMGGDSLSAVQLINQINNTFGSSLTVTDLYKNSSAAKLADKITAKKTTQNEINWQKEWETGLFQLPQPTEKSTSANIFITGVTGFLGIHLLSQLLLKTNNNIIYCHVRAANQEEALFRLSKSFKDAFLWNSILENEFHRLKIILGNLSKPYFELSLQEYSFLASDIGTIYHNAAWVHSFATYDMLKEANVDATVQILRLSVDKTLKNLVFISTISVFDKSKSERHHFLESTNLSIYEPRFLQGYGQTKWVSDVMLQKAREINPNIKIFRPAFIGSSKEGHSNVLDFNNRFIRAILKLKMYPNLESMLDMLPVDICAESIVQIAMSETKDFVFHLANSKGISLNILGTFIDSELKSAEYNEWRTKLVEMAETDQELAVILPYFPNSGYLGAKPYLLDCANSKKIVNLDFEITQNFIQKQIKFIEMFK